MRRRFLFSWSSFLSILIPILLDISKTFCTCQIYSQPCYKDAIFGDHRETGHRRMRRTPAVWGDPPPDYSEAQLESGQTYLYALLFVDLKISDHYRRDHDRVKAEVMKLAGEANKYFYQINLRLIIVDILETMKNDLSLYSFEDYRNKRLHQLPFHNFAVLLSYRYAGGLAFVGGLCSAKSVMLTGFYPHNPEAMGSIFFHEVGHLIGVPHAHPNETLNRQPFQPRQLHTVVESNGIPIKHNEIKDALTEKESLNKFLTNLSRQDVPDRSNHCLRIPGFDHDCTLQLMANLVYRNRCLSKELRSSTNNRMDISMDSNRSPMMSNSMKLNDSKFRLWYREVLFSLNCDANTCTRPVPLWIVVISSILISIALVAPVLVFFYMHLCGRHCSSSLLNPRLMHSTSLSLKHKPKFVSSNGFSFSSSILTQPPSSLPRKKFTIKQRHSSAMIPQNSTTKSVTLNPLSSIIVVHSSASSTLPSNNSQNSERLVSPTEAVCSTTAKVERPRRPPPPPPSPRLSVGSPTQSHINMQHKNSTLCRPKVLLLLCHLLYVQKYQTIQRAKIMSQETPPPNSPPVHHWKMRIGIAYLTNCRF
uniref:Peptidase M12B domain-containing protein n=1 Tax=Ditylenchus dipsaci TaxID=166011 RepID=A0A915CU82_9BILA